MGSLRFEGVRFLFYSDDHPPPHVHCLYGGTEIVINLHRDGAVRLAPRKRKATRNLKRSDVKYLLDLAADHFTALLSMWDSIHG